MSAPHRLPQPQAKAVKGGGCRVQAPLPVCLGVGERHVCLGEYDGESVCVRHSDDAKRLYNMGCFGSYRFDSRQERKREWWELKSTTDVDAPQAVTSEIEIPAETLLVTPREKCGRASDKSDESELGVAGRLRSKPTTNDLILTLEETFFLAYALGCVLVRDVRRAEETFLDVSSMWRDFCGKVETFPWRYVCYHHYRSRLWVVRPGHALGADYLLYEQGMARYHATYACIITPTSVGDGGGLQEEGHTLSATMLAGENRVLENVNKHLLLCYVIQPPGIDMANIRATHTHLAAFKVKEVLVQRWDPKTKGTSSTHDNKK